MDLTLVSALQSGRADFPSQSDVSQSAEEMRQLAKDFEKAFVSEMLRHSGLGEMPSTFNGGPGEAAFSGMIADHYAEEIARTGGLGLSDHIFRVLSERQAQ